MSEEWVRSELEAMERDARYALFCQNHPFQIAVREYQRQARDAVSQAVQESSERCEAVVMREVQGIRNRYEGRMGENEKKVAHGIGSEAREALRGQRNRTLQEHQEAGEREYVLQNPDAFLNVVTGRQFFRRVS